MHRHHAAGRRRLSRARSRHRLSSKILDFHDVETWHRLCRVSNNDRGRPWSPKEARHGQFRPDNPLFSSLRLGNGWLTVRDAYDLNLHSSLVTLSACETGVSTVAPGDELIGLARGFFAAGSPSLLISLWTVDDDATATLMIDFYGHLQRRRSPATALREAQLRLLQEKQHPFFWSPFVLMGRW